MFSYFIIYSLIFFVVQGCCVVSHRMYISFHNFIETVKLFSLKLTILYDISKLIFVPLRKLILLIWNFPVLTSIFLTGHVNRLVPNQKYHHP